MSVVPAFLHQSIADSAREHNESAEKLFDPTVLSTDDLQAIVSSQAVNFASQPVVVAASMEIAKRQRAATDASAVVEATRYSDGSVIQPPFPPHC